MRRAGGFTLVELVIVIVILSIISVISVRFIQFSAQGALDTANRQQLGMAAGIVSEQVSRELRSALPGSVRVNGDQSCIEFIPILTGSRYLDIPLTEPADEFEAVAASPDQSFSGRAVVYSYADGDLYSPGSPGAISDLIATVPQGTGEVTVSFSGGDHEFLEDSPTRRFFIVGEPVALAQESGGRFLYRYSGYGFQSGACDNLPSTFSTTGASREVVAAPLLPDSLSFDFVPPTLQRNGVITLEFELQSTQSEERIGVAQEVQIRNVP